MRTKTLPLPAAPHRFHSLRTQPLLHFRFSLLIPARLQELLHSHSRALPPAAPHRFHSLRTQPLLLLHFRFSLVIPARLRELLHSHPRPLRRLRRNDSRPDKFCPPSSRRCREFPSTAPASCRQVSRRW